jgi:hypothetical protein
VSEVITRMVLFIMKATPAWPVGLVGSSNIIISRFLLKVSWTCLVLSWFRCVSCSASIAIQFLYIVLLMVPHFCIREVSLTVHPLIFRVVMFMLALFIRFSLRRHGAILSPGMGLGWCAHLHIHMWKVHNCILLHVHCFPGLAE